MSDNWFGLKNGLMLVGRLEDDNDAPVCGKMLKTETFPFWQFSRVQPICHPQIAPLIQQKFKI